MIKNNYFDFNKPKEEVIKKEDVQPSILYSEHLHFSYATIKNVERDMIIPDKGGIVFLDTDCAFNGFDLIYYLATKYPMKHLLASTYSISKKTIDSMIYLHDNGMIEQMKLLISESMIKRNPNTIDNLMGMKSSRANLDVLFSWVHAKVYLMQTHDNYFVLEGSGNLSNNAHFEQYILVNSKEVFEHRKQRIFENDKIVKY